MGGRLNVVQMKSGSQTFFIHFEIISKEWVTNNFHCGCISPDPLLSLSPQQETAKNILNEN